MATSRRDFLKKGTLVALAAGVPLKVVPEVFGKTGRAPIYSEPDLSLAAFRAQLNTLFRIKQGNSGVLVKLIEVSDLVHRKNARPGSEGFSLIFSGPRSRALKQDSYVFEHENLCTFQLLIVPLSQSERGTMLYEAVVNRLYP